MKLEKISSNGVLYKNKIQNNYKNMFTSKMNEIESLINDENLEDRQKTLEIQKKNAYYKLEKLDKELENIENYVGEEKEELESIYLNEEENLKNKINDIRQKNINIQEQIKMMRDYYNNFLLKYKNKQITEKRELNEECNKIRENIIKIKCYTKMTDEEKIILEKENEIANLDKELENVLKKIEEAKTKKYISNIRLKELRNIISKNNNKKIDKKKKEIPKKRNNYSENKKIDFGDILTNIKKNTVKNENLNKNNKNRISQEQNNESTINIINRKLPFSISALDNLINEQSNEYKFAYKKEEPKILKSKPKMINLNPINQNKQKKKNFNFNIPIKKNIIKTNSSSENKINLNNKIINNNLNNSGYKRQSNKYRNFNIINSNSIEKKNTPKNIVIENKNENKNLNKIKDNSPLGWLEDDSNIDKIRNERLNNDNKSNGLSNNNQENAKINNSEELNKKDNIFNDRNLEISGIQGTFNRRKPFASIKF
jgi:hypothetical protein